MLPSVSVVMAAFDAERFVGEAIESALAQDYPGELVEVIVVDDGSTDATAAIARHHADASGRVRVIGRANGGNVAATKTASRTPAATWSRCSTPMTPGRTTGCAAPSTCWSGGPASGSSTAT